MLHHSTLARRLTAALLTLLLVACQPSPQQPHRQVTSTLALSPDGATLAVLNPDLPTLTLVEAASMQSRGSVAVGAQPRSVAFTPDGRTALVASGSGEVSFVDVPSARRLETLALDGQPFGIVTTASRAFVSLFALGQIVVVDFASRAVVGRIAVEPFPAGLALTSSGLLVTHFYSGRVSRINVESLAVERVSKLHPEANLSAALALSPDGRTAYLPQTLSHASNPNLSAATTMETVVNVLSLSDFTATPALALSAEGAPANLPLAAIPSPDARWLFVASAGTNSIVVVDLTTGQPVGAVATGAYPTGLALSADGKRLFVNNALAATVTAFDVEYPNDTGTTMPRLSPAGEVVLGPLPLAPEVLLGKRLFNSALPPMGDGRISCAACHFEGGHDARTWLGFPDGPRNTPALFDVSQTQPYHWSGDRPLLQDVELTIRDIQHGAGLLPDAVTAGDTAGRSAELDALAAYMATLAAPLSPFSIDAETQRRGEIAFARWGCAGCHTGAAFTDRELHPLQHDQIGDAALQRNPRGLTFDTPGLLGVWASGPYFHDGSSATLRDTLFRSGFHGMGWAMDKQEVEDVVAYMLALPIAERK